MLKFINDTALVFLLKVLKEFITYKEKDGGISSVAESPPKTAYILKIQQI